MFLKSIDIAPARVAGLLDAAEAAARAIPPAFPLEATVAVNPFMGQATLDLAGAAARLGRVAGVRLTLPRSQRARQVAEGTIGDDDLAEALIACRSPLKPADLALLKARLADDGAAPTALPTVTDLARDATGIDFPAMLARCFGLWAGGHFDQGQALWTPRKGQGAFAAWREWATHDLTPEIAGLTGFCAHVAAAPDSAERAILRASERLEISAVAAETVFHRALADLGGWAQHARWLLWQAELAGGTDTTLTDLLAIRLIWDEAMMEHCPGVRARWQATVAAHARPVAPSPDQVIDAIVQDAAERAHQRRLSALLSGPVALPGRPALQAAFCIDVRSEVLRRALEQQDPRIATLGFAGFFGLPVAHRERGSDLTQPHLPALLVPSLTATRAAEDAAEQALRITARATRAWGRFRQAAVSSFAFVEAAGPGYGWKLVKGALGMAEPGTEPAAPRLETALDAAQKARTAAAVLKAMGLTTGHARLVLLIGHGACTTNNPHDSAYQCGACHGHTGEVSARLLAGLLNDPETRAGLPLHGIALPTDTLFVAGLHDTVGDAITLYPDQATQDHDADLAQARRWLAAAGLAARTERARRLPGAVPADMAKRGTDWSEVRPEWGLAGCAAFIAAPRRMTAGRDLQGRAFLHDYDWTTDRDFATLTLILTAPVVVASWISLQYYGSVVAPEAFGGGNKLLHNVSGGLGVVEGNGGLLRAGLPWQAVHDGQALVHDPLRLSVLIEAPTDAIDAILAGHPAVQALFDNGWLSLCALKGGRMVARRVPGGGWADLASGS